MYIQFTLKTGTVPKTTGYFLYRLLKLHKEDYHCSLMAEDSFKTISTRTTHNTLIKPGELVDVVELTPLQLTDRRTYNLMLGAAWDKIDEDVEHVIRKRERVKIERDGQPYTMNMPLLETVAEPVRADGNVYYRFPRELRKLISDSSIFARLQKDVMFALSSKYALALYEMVQKRGNLRYKTQETFTVDELRDLLGVQTGKLKPYKNFKSRALKPAVDEVNGLANYGITFRENKVGKTVETITLGWWQKSEDELKLAFRELQASKIGRRVRIREKQQ
jgi:plasmid replication initiation protein